MHTCQISSIAVRVYFNSVRKVRHTLPRRLQSALQLARLDKIRVLDAPSGDGTYLRCFGPGSVGLELQEQMVMNGRANGLDVRQCNLEEDEDWRVEESSFDAIWCSNYFEHSMSPHQLLINFRRYLKDDGLLVIPLPVLPSFNISRVVLEKFGIWREVYAEDHINFFTETSARKTFERAGYGAIRSIVGSFPSPMAFRLSQVLKPIWFGMVFICHKVPNWDYPRKAHKKLVDGRIVFKN
jgi:SAM-dependent methyltransferase